MAAQDLIREAQDPSTSAARLAELVQADRATWPSVAAHPAAYDGLLQWLSERNDAATNVVLSARATNQSAPSVPPVAPAAPVAPVAPVFSQPVAEPTPAEPTPAEQPVVEPVVEPVVDEVTPADAAETQVTPAAEAQPEPTVVAPFEPVTHEAPAAEANEPTVVQPLAAEPARPSWAPSADATQTYASAPTHSDPTADKSKRNVWLLAAMVAAVLVLIGGIAFGATKVFGGDDDKDDTPTAAKTTDSDSSSDADADADNDIPDISSDDSDDPSLGGDGKGGEFCTAMTDLNEASTDMLADSGTPDLDDLKDMANEMRAGYDRVQDAAPDDLKDEIEVMSDYLDLMENPSAAASEDFSDKIKDYTDASMEVSKYYATTCY